MKRSRFAAVGGIIAVALASTAPIGAEAQTKPAADDVVIMRRVLTTPKRRPSAPVGEWNVGAWPDASQQCGIVRITREVTCIKGEGQCTTPRPDDEDEVFGKGTDCPFQWQVGGYGEISSTCSPTAVRQRDVRCVDRSGTSVGIENWEIAYKPDPVETTEAFQSCTYDWVTGPWTGSCTQSTPRTRTASCTMLEYALPADAAKCSSAKPELSQPVSAPERCDKQWRSGAWTSWDSTCSNAAKRSRIVECIDDQNAVTDDARCAANQKPTSVETRRIVDSCPIEGIPETVPDAPEKLTYSWKSGEFGALSSTCSPAAARTREVTCIDSLGRSAEESRCNASIRPANEETTAVFSGCIAIWASSTWGPWSSTCSATANRDRDATCLRTDGANYAAAQDDDACDATRKPTTSETGPVYSSCTYRWVAGAYVTPSACGATTATRAVACQRVGGNEAVVEDALCAAADRPASTMPATDMSTCRYEWSVSEYGPYSSSCSTTASRSRTAVCTRVNDQQPVADSLCAGETPPKLAETAEVTTGCSYAWATTPITEWAQAGMCAASKTRGLAVTCMRSDGQTAADGKCSGTKPGDTETQALPECSYGWNAVYAPEVASCGPATRAGTTTCLRADGQTVADDKCDPTKKPAASLPYTNYGSCTFGWIATPLGNWDSTCANNASRTATISCQRSDGQAASDAQCNAATKPASTLTGINTTGCAGAFTNLEFESNARWSSGNSYGTSGGRSGRYMQVAQGGSVAQAATTNLKASSRYRVEFWARSDFSSSVVSVYMNNTSGAAYNPVNISLTGKWTLYSVTLVPKTSSSAVYPLELNFFDGRNGFWIDGVTFYAIAP